MCLAAADRRSLFLDVEARRDLGRGWSVGADRAPRLDRLSRRPLQTSGYGFDLAKTGVATSGDRLGLRLAQPLRVESGGYPLLLPVAYDYATQTATTDWRTISLAPSGREVDGELSYGAHLFGGRGWLGGNLFYRRQPGHSMRADDDMGAAIRFTLGFK